MFKQNRTYYKHEGETFDCVFPSSYESKKLSSNCTILFNIIEK